ncbi:MAG TPA: amidohydrolase family protein [Gemmatimonadales bacterium]
MRITRNTALIALLALPATLVAQAPAGGAAGGPPKKPLPLEASRKAEFTATKGTWISLDVSPDGQTIVFDLLGDLYTLPIAGGKATRLTDGLAYDAQPRFSPDGKKVVFISDRSGGDNVWIMSLDGEDTTQVTQGNGNLYVSPEYVPDGKYVVASRTGGLGGAHKIWMYPVEGGSGLQLTRDPANLKTLGAAFTPNGRYMWFTARQGDWHYNAAMPQTFLGWYDRETGRISQMSNRYGAGFRPVISPDGRWMTFGGRHETRTGLRIRDLKNGEERWLLFPIQRDDIESRAPLDFLPGYSFTPDSRQLVISYGGEIWRVAVEGGTPQKIAFEAPVKLDVGPEVKFSYRIDTAAAHTAKQIRNATPSPDGKRLAFTSFDRLYVVDLPDGTPRRVSSANTGEYHPAWSPDGTSLAWVSWDDRTGGHIWKTAVQGRMRPVQVTRAAALYYNIAWSPNGSRIVASRAPARQLQEATGAFFGPVGAEFVWVASAGGDATLISPAGNRDVMQFVADDTTRIYAYGPAEGLVSFRWDGTDVKQHLRVNGPPPPAAGNPHEDEANLVYLPRRLGPIPANLLQTGPHPDDPTEPAPPVNPAGLILIGPKGDQALAQVGRDLYTLPIPVVGGQVPTASVAQTTGGPVPVRKLTEVGAEFPAWSSDGRLVHWSIGNAFFTYNLDRAKVVEDSLKAIEKAKADSTKRATAAADSLKKLKTRVDSLTKANAPVPDSLKIPFDSLTARAKADSIVKAKADSTAKAKADSLKAKGDTAKKAEEKPGYKPDHRRFKVESSRDLPRGVVVLRGARAITMKGKEIIENADVVVRDNRIVAVGPQGQVQVPGGARVIDVTGKTVLPGYVDTHYHPQWLHIEFHQAQAWQYLATLAYGVTTTRDPQTATSDVVSYQDRVETGGAIGPRIYSTGPGVFAGENIRDLDHAKNVLRRYSDYWDTKTLKMYMSGNRQQRQWIIMAAKELGLMPTTEGGLDFKLNLTHAMDGYPGIEHALPIAPIYDDVVQLFKASQTTNSPTLLVSYGGPFGENYFYTTENVLGDKKLARFMPQDQIDARARRRGAFFGYPQMGWFHKDEYVYPKHAEFVKALVEGGARAGVGSHGQIQGIGYQWELWAMASGGIAPHDLLRVATIYGAEAIGMGQDVGSLEAGKFADLQVLDANPLENIRNTNTIRYVMKNGRLYEGDTLNEIWPRKLPLSVQHWARQGPQSVNAGIPE